MVCPFSDEEWDIHDPMSSEFRLSDCPLVPVSDHGRLIDGDAIVRKCKDEKGGYYSYESAVIGEAVDSAPTIISADKEAVE